MDEEQQGLASPVAGSLRGIRRSVSSGVFTGRSVLPQPAPPDPQTTQLLTQNSLTLTSVSNQLQTVTAQVGQLSTSLNLIRNNLAVSDQLERQREAEKQRREAILAEQGLREGKESALEAKIQNALLFPVRRIAAKAQGILSRFAQFMFTLAAGWLTSQTLQFFKLKAEGNVDALSRFKRQFLSQLLFGTSIVLLLKFGLGKIKTAFGFIAAKALKIKLGSILRAPFVAVINFLRANIDNFRNVLVGGFKKFASEAPQALVKTVGRVVTNPLSIFGGALGVEGIRRFFNRGAADAAADTAQTAGKGFLRKIGVGRGFGLDVILEPLFSFMNYNEEVKQLEEEGKDTEQNKKRAAFGETGGAIGALTTTAIAMAAIPEPASSVVGGLTLLGIGIFSQLTGRPLGNMIGRKIAGDENTKEDEMNNVDATKQNLDASSITPVNKNLERIFDVSNLDDSPQFVPFDVGGGNENVDTSGPTTSSKDSQVKLPNISSSDLSNTFLGISNSMFNVD